MSSKKLPPATDATEHELCRHPQSLLAECSREDVSPGTDALLQRKYRELTRKHLGDVLDQMFSEFTGLHFHIAWAPLASHDWDARSLPTGCSVCCRIAGTSLAAQPVCQICGSKQLARALDMDGDGLAFTCRLGVQNYWLPIRVRNVIVGIAYLQALDCKRPAEAARQRSTRAAAKVLSRPDFQRAGRLLCLMIQHLQTLDLAELRKDELTNAGHAVVALEIEQARLHEALQRHLPAPPQVFHRAETETHTDQAVSCLLECISENFARPITLERCAAKLGMNAAYLSSLFSRTVGRPFKTYLTEVRMEMAKQLLSDPTRIVSDVAFAVGYASGNRFRLAFKKTTGLAPTIWRETMQSKPPSPPPST